MNSSRDLTKGVEMLNWEKDRRKSQVREYSPDTLPDSGSWQDRVRWEKENILVNKSSRRSFHRVHEQTFTPLDHQARQLELYVTCLKSAYFYEKPSEHRSEIVANTRKLISRVKSGKNSSLHHVLALAEQATSLIEKINN
jgi:hypothetical protein